MPVSAIVLCKNQRRNLPVIIKALRRQTRKPDEVIVVDDRSNDEISKLVQSLGCRYVSTSVCLDKQRKGARALARELGSREAKCQVLAYLDGDMVPAPRFIEDGSAIARRGCLVKLWREFSLTMSGGTVRNKVRPTVGQGQTTLSYSEFTSDCFLVHRDAAHAVGGWDEKFEGWGEEDIEFAYRASLEGLPIISLRGSRTFAIHIDHPIDPVASFLELRQNAEYFSAKHPQILRERARLWRSLGVYMNAYGSFYNMAAEAHNYMSHISSPLLAVGPCR